MYILIIVYVNLLTNGTVNVLTNGTANLLLMKCNY